VSELESKLARVRAELGAFDGVRLRSTDWYSWATCGGSNVVLQTSDVGVAEVVITRDDAFVLSDSIEAERLRAEESPLQVRTSFSFAGRFATELPVTLRWSLLPEEIERYRALGRDAAVAVSQVLRECHADQTGFALAGAAAEALWSRGIHPALILVGDERRLPMYRHPTPTKDRLGERAMLVVCGRRHGLFANLTRFVYFRPPSAEEQVLSAQLTGIEAAAFGASRPGATLGEVYRAMAAAYARYGHPGAESKLHQGGPCGYLPRDAFATPTHAEKLQRNNAAAWNPSLSGAKIEDTILIRDEGIEVLTRDPSWPLEHDRPAVLVR
jgi:Xaa-Pro aminopeptidase